MAHNQVHSKVITDRIQIKIPVHLRVVEIACFQRKSQFASSRSSLTVDRMFSFSEFTKDKSQRKLSKNSAISST